MRCPADGSWTAESAVLFATDCIAFVRQRRVERKEEVPCGVFLLVQGGLVPLYGLQALTGEPRGRAIREAARKYDARYVVAIYEAWLARTEGEAAQAALKAHRAAGGEIRTFAGRYEVLMCTLDGPGLMRIWSCQILPDGSTSEPVDACPPKAQVTGNIVNLSGRLGEN